MAFAMILRRRSQLLSGINPLFVETQSFRSDAALEALWKTGEDEVPNLVFYNYPSFSGAFSALFAYLFHARVNQRCCILPFSYVEPFRVEDIPIEKIKRCYFLDCIGPDGFAAELSRRSKSELICFDHRKSVMSRIQNSEECFKNVEFHVDVGKSSSSAAYEYFSNKLMDMMPSDGERVSLLSNEDREPVESVLKYIEDGDLQRWSLQDIKAFNLGIKDWRSRLNCITNQYVFEQLPKIRHAHLISKGKSQIDFTRTAATDLLRDIFRVRLGRGLYGECLAVRADGHSKLSDEIGKMLSIKSAKAGLRPIGAVIYMQRQKLKMCLRSTNPRIDTSEVAKAYGGGGSPSSSSFIIRMDEYNEWRKDALRPRVKMSEGPDNVPELRTLILEESSCNVRV